MSEPHSDPQPDPPELPRLGGGIAQAHGQAAQLPQAADSVAQEPGPGPSELPALPARRTADPPAWTAPQAERLPWVEPPPAAAAPSAAAAPAAALAPPIRPPEGGDLDAQDPALAPRRGTSAVLPALPELGAEPEWRDRWRGYAALAGLLLLALALAIPQWQRQRTENTVPQANTLLKAAELLGTLAKPGDAVAFAPGWSSHQQMLFQQRWLDKGWDPKADFLTAHPVDLWQADGKLRLWVVTTHGWSTRLNLPAQSPGVKRLEQHNLGHGTAVELYSLPTSTTVFDVRKQLDRTAAQTGGPQDWKACTWQPASGRFGCGGPSWQDVWQDLQEVGNTRRDCIYLHPPHDRGAVRVTATEPTAVRVQGWFGNRLWAMRHGPEGAPVRFRVLVGGQTKFEKTVATDDFGWHPFEVALPPEQRGQPVTFEAYSDKEAWREFCLDARLQGPSAPLTAKATP